MVNRRLVFIVMVVKTLLIINASILGERARQSWYSTFKIIIFYQLVSFLSAAEIAQLGERQTEDLKVPGSNPESSYEL